MTFRKRILICGQIYGYGGLEAHFVNLSKLLVENGAEVTFAARRAAPDVLSMPVWRDLPVKRLTTPFRTHGGRASTAWALTVWPFQLSRPYDVVYTCDWTWFIVFLAQFLKPNGYILGGRGGEAPRTRPYPPGSGLFDGLIVETSIQAEGYDLNVPIRAIPLLSHVSSPPRRRHRTADQLRVAFMGRLEVTKGVLRLLDLWPNLDIQPATLHYYGMGSAEEVLKDAIRDRKLSNCVFVHGPYSGEAELAAAMDATDLLVLPTGFLENGIREQEGFPLSLLEAMGHGVPFVASDVGAIRVMAEDNPDVRVVPLDNSAFQVAIEEMARGIRNGAVRGDRLQEYHFRRYSYEKIAQQWLLALLEPDQFWNTSPTGKRRNARALHVLREQLRLRTFSGRRATLSS